MLLVAGAALLLTVGLGALLFGPGHPQPNARVPDASTSLGPARSPVASSETPPEPPAPTASRSPRPGPSLGPHSPTGDLPLVPVVSFWSGRTDISSAELAGALAGRLSDYSRVIVPADERAAIEAQLEIRLAPNVETGDAAAIRRAVGDGALGLLHLTDVTPAVRALSLDGIALFGNGRAGELGEWPLRAAAGADADRAAGGWRQGSLWTLVAGGDIQLDRWMAYHVWRMGKGVDWPWDGGSVRITDRLCCSDLGWELPEWESNGNPGAVRALFAGADLAMANLEAAAVDDPAFHRLPRNFRFSLSFSGNPRLLDGLANAGFDFLSLANNHIHNAGAQGIADTRRNLAARGFSFAGAGRDLGQASQPAQLDAGGQRITVLPCITVGRLARADRAGSAPCVGERLLRQIEEAAEASDLVIVFPHWGREYRATPSTGQRSLARAWAEAGADLVIGAHSHWVGSIEEIGDALVFYSLGNLAFDQPWSEPTMQGAIVELTFDGDRLVQVALHPTLIVDDVQPNLLEFDGGGDRVLQRMRDASEGLLPY